MCFAGETCNLEPGDLAEAWDSRTEAEARLGGQQAGAARWKLKKNVVKREEVTSKVEGSAGEELACSAKCQISARKDLNKHHSLCVLQVKPGTWNLER